VFITVIFSIFALYDKLGELNQFVSCIKDIIGVYKEVWNTKSVVALDLLGQPLSFSRYSIFQPTVHGLALLF
jgi:hypothetical protein